MVERPMKQIVLLFMMLVACRGDDAAEADGAVAAMADAASSDPADQSAAAFADCTCGDTLDDPGPGDFGCAVPRIIYQRVCLIDSSCNAYSIDASEDPLPVTTDRPDVAIRWEWAEEIPSDADLSLNDPPEGLPAYASSLSLFAKQDPSVADLPLFVQPETAINADVLVASDRRSITMVPSQRCLEGNWLVEAGITLEQMYGGPVCGETEGSQLGYIARFVLE
jgi:hypothetical protein